MSATLDFVSRTDWTAVVPGIVLLPGAERYGLTMTPLKPKLSVDFVLIAPKRGTLSLAAQKFATTLHVELAKQHQRLVRVSNPSEFR